MRIAHFSDLHLLSLEGARMFDYANKRWIGRLNLLTSRSRYYHSYIFEAMVADLNAMGVDHVVCTGDLTNLAFAQEFRFAKEIFDRLELGPKEVTIVPGNHDSYVAEGLDHFEEHFGPYHRSDGDWAGEHTWPLVRVRGQVAFIGISTSRPSPWFTAYGRIGDGQLARVAEVLADPRLEDKVRIVLLHHPLTGKSARNPVRGLKGHRRLQKIIAEHGAELVLHGHEHRDMRLAVPGPKGEDVPVLGIQAGTYLALRPQRTARYRIVEIGDGGAGAGRPRVAGHRLRLWHQASEGFIDDPDDLPQDAAASNAVA